MKTACFALVAVLTLSAVTAEPAPRIEPPPDAYLLIESELGRLPASERPITIELERAAPEKVLRKVAKLSGLAIDVQGTFPEGSALTVSFRDTKAKEVLTWLAQQVRIQFRAEPPNTLRVFVEKPAPKTEPS